MSLLAAGVTASQFEVVGIDISADVLVSATQGRYGNNAFRSELTECERRFFGMEKSDLLVIESVKSFVTFRQHNLVQPLSDELGLFDIILCRNVLIYLTPTVQQNVLSNLTSQLNPNGVLILTPAESSLMKDSRLSVMKGERREFFSFSPQSVEPSTKTNFRTVKRASDLIIKTADYSAQKMAECAVRKEISQTIITSLSSPSPSPSPSRSPSRSPSPSPSLDGAEQRANEGKFSEAQKLLIEYLRANPYDIHGQFLMGVVTDAVGDQLAAREQYRRVLYLNPNHFEALSHLALLEQRLGNQRQAQLLTTRARRVFVSGETADE